MEDFNTKEGFLFLRGLELQQRSTINFPSSSVALWTTSCDHMTPNFNLSPQRCNRIPPSRSHSIMTSAMSKMVNVYILIQSVENCEEIGSVERKTEDAH